MTSFTRRMVFELDPTRVEHAQNRFMALGWLGAAEELRSLESAGSGNMNLTLRARTSTRSFIVKQGRGWVEKYPTIPAPADRTLTEASFYRAVSRDPQLACLMPGLLGIDEEARMLALEDLGPVSDLTPLYGGGELRREELIELSGFLSRLHALPIPVPERVTFENRAMRQLNYEHVFVVPFVHDNGLNLDAVTAGLQALARVVVEDRDLVDRIAVLGATYLEAGPCLLHGDFYPGSWLRTPQGMRVIDPEFCFLGVPELDLGVAVGHLLLAGRGLSDVHVFLEHYRGPSVPRRALILGFAGVEVLRRLLGVAQLPLAADLAAKSGLIRRARALLLGELA